MTSKNVKALHKARPPKNQIELRSFLDICNHYRRFVKNYDHIAHPLTRKQSKDQPFEFEVLTDEEFDAFR